MVRRQRGDVDARRARWASSVGQRLIPVERLSIVTHPGMPSGFAALMLATMRIDYIRFYEPEGGQSVACDPPGYETTEYIARRADAYSNPNWTSWYGCCVAGCDC
jgi:hypothetical protein